MTLFFKISNDGQTILGEKRLDDGVGYNSFETSRVNGKPFLAPVTVTYPPYDPATEVKEGPVDAYDLQTNTATRTYSVRQKTQVELDQDQLEADNAAIKAAVKSIGLVTVELVEKLLSDNVIAATDFSADVRDRFQNLKQIADRLRGI
jgi:hypothetical protein